MRVRDPDSGDGRAVPGTHPKRSLAERFRRTTADPSTAFTAKNAANCAQDDKAEGGRGSGEFARRKAAPRYSLQLPRVYRHIGTAGVGSEKRCPRRHCQDRRNRVRRRVRSDARIFRSQPFGTGPFLPIPLSLVAKIRPVSATPRSADWAKMSPVAIRPYMSIHPNTAGN
jgi:hypothetical protein